LSWLRWNEFAKKASNIVFWGQSLFTITFQRRLDSVKWWWARSH